MKICIALLLAASVSAPFAVLAGEDKDKTISDAQLSRMQKRLGVTDDQLEAMRKIRGEGGSKKDIRSVLTDEQKVRAQELKAAREAGKKDKSQDEGKGGISDKKLAKMQESLGLSDEQVAQMRQIRDEGGSAKDMRAALTEEQKADAQARKKEREERKKAEGKD